MVDEAGVVGVPTAEPLRRVGARSVGAIDTSGQIRPVTQPP